MASAYLSRNQEDSEGKDEAVNEWRASERRENSHRCWLTNVPAAQISCCMIGTWHSSTTIGPTVAVLGNIVLGYLI